MNIHHKPIAIAAVYGFAAGAVAAITLALMTHVQHILWSGSWADLPLYIAAVIMAGGILLAWIQHLRHDGSAIDGNFDRQLASLHSPLSVKKRDTLLIALSAVVAVGFGGAVGPEAGLLAVVAECSAIVSLLLANSYSEQRLIKDTGAIAALSGLYGAPPGVAVLVDENENSLGSTATTPLPIKFLAGVCGFGGFLLLANWLLPSGFQQLPLPDYTSAGNGSDIIFALPASLCGAALGLLFVRLHHTLPLILKHLAGTPVRQILLASGVFALISALFPLLRFSGHHELEQVLEFGIHSDTWPLIGLALGKVFAATVCLAGGWRGGEFFPSVFAASALAGAVHLLLPSVPLTVAVMGAAGAMTTVCLGKPFAVLLIMLLMAGIQAPGALFTGILIGWMTHKIFVKYNDHWDTNNYSQ